jgi:hypothetical protein
MAVKAPVSLLDHWNCCCGYSNQTYKQPLVTFNVYEPPSVSASKLQ